jgi:hypothetical protein
VPTFPTREGPKLSREAEVLAQLTKYARERRREIDKTNANMDKALPKRELVPLSTTAGDDITPYLNAGQFSERDSVLTTERLSAEAKHIAESRGGEFEESKIQAAQKWQRRDAFDAWMDSNTPFESRAVAYLDADNRLSLKRRAGGTEIPAFAGVPRRVVRFDGSQVGKHIDGFSGERPGYLSLRPETSEQRKKRLDLDEERRQFFNRTFVEAGSRFAGFGGSLAGLEGD